MKLRIWEPVLILAAIAIAWLAWPRPAPPTPAVSSPALEAGSPAPAAGPPGFHDSAVRAEAGLIKAASGSGEVIGIVVIRGEDGQLYGATLTMPDESPGLKQTELWQCTKKGWVSAGILGATIGPPPDPKEFPEEWYEANHFSTSARQRMAGQEWKDLRP